MEHEREPLCCGGKNESICLYDGIDLSYTDLAEDRFSSHHTPSRLILHIHYCRSGQLVWKTSKGGCVFLNPGDFSVHTSDLCADSSFHFPTGRYQGLILRIDLQTVCARPPELIAQSGVFDCLLDKRFSQNGAVFSFNGNEESQSIFSGFYDKPKSLALAYQRLKTLELLLYLAQIPFDSSDLLPEYQAKQVEIVREIHDLLLAHMQQRITIEVLSKQYHLNPTTLKSAFKAVYGTSLAAHIKMHRMEQAAKLLRETDMSIAQIALAVGYDSPSKFSTSFKAYFHILPREYRKNASQS